MSSPQATSAQKDCPPPEELECKICYQRYNPNNRKPKILDCLHRVCSRCLIKILDITDGAGYIPCPFCRHQTEITEYQVSALPDDVNIMSHLATRDKSCSLDQKREVVLTPKSLSSTSPSHDSSNCLVITIMEVQRDSQRSPSHNDSSDVYAEQSLDSVSIGSNGPTDHDALVTDKLSQQLEPAVCLQSCDVYVSVYVPELFCVVTIRLSESLLKQAPNISRKQI
ncbi:hypothetical protein GOODEAATRI_026250 [Goodea atripinnis]|uniref:E3 ubiquitin-protein ligase RNF182 n=1 Tax=Goodea atripinnis TaxID=208336 RepID=A0ABV0MNT7_9TELE